jgi:hypothetical protein
MFPAQRCRLTHRRLFLGTVLGPCTLGCRKTASGLNLVQSTSAKRYFVSGQAKVADLYIKVVDQDVVRLDISMYDSVVV